MVGTRHNSNQELIGQGAANILAPLFGGFAATGAIARTATSVRNGATSPLAGIVHSVFLILAIVVFAPMASHVPLAALLFMRRMAESVSVQQEVFGGREDRDERAEAAPEAPLPPNVLVYSIDGPFFFGAAEKLESTVERAQLHVEAVVIRLDRVPFMDATGMHTLSEIIERFQRRSIRALLCGIQPRLRRTLERAEILTLVGPDNICADMAGVARRVTPA